MGKSWWISFSLNSKRNQIQLWPEDFPELVWQCLKRLRSQSDLSCPFSDQAEHFSKQRSWQRTSFCADSWFKKQPYGLQFETTCSIQNNAFKICSRQVVAVVAFLTLAKQWRHWLQWWRRQQSNFEVVCVTSAGSDKVWRESSKSYHAAVDHWVREQLLEKQAGQKMRLNPECLLYSKE